MSDGYDGWQQRPRARRGRYEPDEDYGSMRRARSGASGPPGWDDEPGYGGADGYPGQDQYGGYGETGGHRGGDWAAEQDPYSQTDPNARTAPRDPYRQPDPYADGGGYADPQAYREGYGGQDEYDARYGQPASYGDPHSYPGQQPYDGQEPYNGRPAFGEQDRYGGQDPYRDGYDTGSYSAEPGYQGQPDYGRGYEEYDGYGQPAASGPVQYPAGQGYGPDELAGWQQEEDGPVAAGGPGGSPRRGSRRDSGAYELDDAGLDRQHGGRRSGRGMNADERQSEFFAGYGGDDDDYDPPPRRRRGMSAGFIALLIILVVIAGAAGVGYHFYSAYKDKHSSYTGNGFGSVVVTVKPGDSLDSIAPQLLQLGVIKSIDPWAQFVSSKPNDLQPGEFKLHEHMGLQQAWAMLTNAKDRVSVTATIPDGARWLRFLPLLAKESGIPMSQFQTAIKDTSALGLPSYANGNPEGFLFPATYDITSGETALQLLQQAVHQFNVEAGTLNLAAGARKTGFTEQHLIIIASLLEGEVGPKYYADVARVIDNRLAQNMTLGLDSTVAYALNDYSYNFTASQLAVNSPYNTTKHQGLPPGPIDSPSAAAIEAAMNPAPPSNTWLYFVTINKSGLTEFTSSYSQFLAWGNEAKKNGL
ncbi:MAG TPA: endolytic transglycosylase MltG [Streptosporangiaceae bacterium]|jgi:UPF0755 protein|nr:endolytic transglycosylase MltG [Streptosporangiaceae bacterium]